MKLQTQIHIAPSSTPIDYNSEILLMGSCFVENIGSKLKAYKFKATVNPFGIIFNPASLVYLVERAVTGNRFDENDVFYHNERWHCYHAHSDLSHVEIEGLLEGLNTGLNLLQQKLQEASHLIFTFGTAWVYRLKETSEIVANCHKVPQVHFDKELLSIVQIEQYLARLGELIYQLNPNTQLMFTVSPVRHLKDGFVRNQQSKAHLIAAVHSKLEKIKSWDYFPAYEIVMDELRDYRFFAEDMIHPNQLAIDYIWEKFIKSMLAGDTGEIMKRVEVVSRGLKHRPFNPDSQAHQKFLKDLHTKIEKLEKEFPFMDFK